MPVYFFDSSAIVKRYLTEVGSPWVRGLTDPVSANDLFLVRITGAEVVSAFTRQSPPLPASHVTRVLADLRYDFGNQYQLLEVNEAVIERAMVLAETYRLRGYDAVQLAGAVELVAVARTLGSSTLTFVSADARLNLAAMSEGLTVDDPASHP